MLFELAIEKSNMEAGLMQFELPGSELILSGHKSEKGATICQTQMRNGGRHVQDTI